MTPLHDNGADWTAADDNAIAAREQAKLRVFDAHREDEPHWRDDLIERFISERAERVLICVAITALILVCALVGASNAGWLK